MSALAMSIVSTAFIPASATSMFELSLVRINGENYHMSVFLDQYSVIYSSNRSHTERMSVVRENTGT